MAERATRRDRLIASAPIVCGQVVVLPIGRLVLEGRPGRTHAWLTASLEPLAVLVGEAGTIRVLALDPALPLAPEDLRPHLGALQAALSPAAPASP
jgi:hypothetical protein